MSDKRNDAIAEAGLKYSAFLNNLEGWIDGMISRDGLTDKELIKIVKERYERSIQANITHHEFMMNNAKKNNDKETADRHKLMAEMYQSLLS